MMVQLDNKMTKVVLVGKIKQVKPDGANGY
jgi:hypothetical protein